MAGGADAPGSEQRLIMKRALLILLLSAAWFAGSALADDAHAHTGVRWQDLSAEQRELLKDFEGRWDQLPLGRQEALARGSERWLSLPPEQRGRMRKRVERWHELDPEQRRELRRRHQEFRELPPEE